jgi:endonuclease III
MMMKKKPTGERRKTAPKKPPALAKKAPAPKLRKLAGAKERMPTILGALEETYPNATTALDWKDPVQLLVATVLSAQCTDVRVNQVTPALFARFPDAGALASAPIAELEELIRTTGFFHNKAKAIKAATKLLAERHGGEVPRSMEAMLELPGGARKTANVVLGTAYALPTGIVVDTHVSRVAGRLGLTSQADPVKIERDLMQLVPQERWVHFSHAMVLHGRHVCQARKPLCESCSLAPCCPSAGTFA